MTSTGAVRKVDWIDPKIFHCGRKAGFPLKVMAERAAEAATKDDGSLIIAYLCEHCNKYHIGHPEKKPQQEEPKMAFKFFYEFEGVLLAKIKDEFNQYIFAVPPGTPENDVAVLERGVLVGYKKGRDIYREKDGRKSTHHNVFYHIFPFYAKELVRFREKIEVHEEFMGEISHAQMDFLNGVYLPLTERVKKSNQARDHAAEQREFAARRLAEEEKRLVQEQEMHNNRAVFRNEEGFKPHHRDFFKCCNEGCGEEIELRAYIRSDAKGYLTTITPRTPVDPRVARKGNSNTLWICGNCMDRVNNPGKYAEAAEEAGREAGREAVQEAAQEAVHEAESKPAVDIAAAGGMAEPEPELSLGIMSDLKRITMDPAFSAAFVRGAMMMAFVALDVREGNA